MPKQVNHSERKLEIAEATFRRIHHCGMDQTTLREIAKEAGFSLGNVQYYFPKQRDVYTFSLEVLYQKFEERMRHAMNEDQSVYENVVTMVKQLVQVRSSEERMENDIWVQFSIMTINNGEYRELMEQYRKKNHDYVLRIINTLDQEQMLRPSICQETESHMLAIFIDGLLFNSVIYPDVYREAFIEKQIVAYLQKICV